MDYQNEYRRWKECAAELKTELEQMDETQIEDAFYRELAFGTGGLRGVIGAGTNRMNRYTVAKASQGLANYVKEQFQEDAKALAIAVSFDSRIKSDLFSKVACSVFAANGIQVWVYEELMPTPCLSFAVRYHHCQAGVMVTASHNPAKYNGYKVYGADGCQITTEAAAQIQNAIESVDVFEDVREETFEKGLSSGMIRFLEPDVYTAFIEQVKQQSVLFGDEADRDVAIVYTPLNGTGLKPVTRVLKEAGFTNVTVVEEQREPDGNFPTCPYPNPEIREAMELGLSYCQNVHADLLLATDPDCDRCGIAVRNGETYQLLTGNEVGLLLLDYICSQRKKHGYMPEHPVFVKTIVTMDLAEKIADHYGVQTVNVLTGFKYIGEVIGKLEAQGREADYICGFEESYGYLTGAYVRDKDAVNAAFMICEMYAYYRKQGITLIKKLQEIYDTYGYCLNRLHSYEFEGSAGMRKMQDIMALLRENPRSLGAFPVLKAEDYLQGLYGLPSSDVLKFYLDGDASVVIRPSGTEPKIKVYISVIADEEACASSREEKIRQAVEQYINR